MNGWLIINLSESGYDILSIPYYAGRADFMHDDFLPPQSTLGETGLWVWAGFQRLVSILPDLVPFSGVPPQGNGCASNPGS